MARVAQRSEHRPYKAGVAGSKPAARIRRPAFNAEAQGFEVDALWRVERVVLEIDSFATGAATRS